MCNPELGWWRRVFRRRQFRHLRLELLEAREAVAGGVHFIELLVRPLLVDRGRDPARTGFEHARDQGEGRSKGRGRARVRSCLRTPRS